MRDHLPGLRLRQAVVHRPGEVERDLLDLVCRDQGADGHQAAIPRGKARTEPQIAEQDLGGVPNDPRSHGAELLPDPRRALGLGGLVEREKRTRRRRELIGLDSALDEDIPRDRGRRHGIRPAGVEREMRDDLGNLARLDATVDRQVEIVRQLDDLIASDQGSEGDDAAIPGRQIGALPKITEEVLLRIPIERGGNLANIPGWHGTFLLCEGVLLRLSRRRRGKRERQRQWEKLLLHGDQPHAERVGTGCQTSVSCGMTVAVAERARAPIIGPR